MTPATQADIAKTLDIDHSHVSHTLARYGIDYNRLDQFRKQRAEIFQGLQDKILSSVTDVDIKDASILQRVTAAGILYDKERLETGKSSANVAVLISQIEAMQRSDE
jgi:hypothetical protein